MIIHRTSRLALLRCCRRIRVSIEKDFRQALHLYRCESFGHFWTFDTDQGGHPTTSRDIHSQRPSNVAGRLQLKARSQAPIPLDDCIIVLDDRGLAACATAETLLVCRADHLPIRLILVDFFGCPHIPDVRIRRHHKEVALELRQKMMSIPKLDFAKRRAGVCEECFDSAFTETLENAVLQQLSRVRLAKIWPNPGDLN